MTSPARPPAPVIALASTVLALAVAAGCGGPRVAPRALVTGAATLELAGEFEVARPAVAPRLLSLPFGGISGLARSPADPAMLLGISDAHPGPRAYRLRVSGEETTFRVDVADTIFLEYAGGEEDIDPEAIAVLPDGDLVVASEGVADNEPRRPPAILRYGPYGEYRGTLEVRDRFVPEPTGPVTHGVRRNAAFESLTVSPSGDRLFTATETALVQDGEAADFEHGTTCRILEYAREGQTYRPRREFAYPMDAMQRPAFEPGEAILGLVELLALDDTHLLALEREYIENKADARASVNRVRIVHVTLAGATDISAVDSLNEARGVVPVTRTLLLDLADVKGLSPALATLENFEGMGLGPRLPDGRATLVLVSDDNFNPLQRTVFLLLAIGG